MAMRYWWVNQNQTYRTEVRGNFLWSPKVNANGARNPFYDSHIKPWRDANDSERLSDENGLLLSPHIDHLFDKGYVSLSNTQQLLVVPEVRSGLLDRWGIPPGVRTGEFNRDQQEFLDYHRTNVGPQAKEPY